MATIIGSGQLTVTDQRDLPALHVAFGADQDLQQTYDSSRSPQYLPDRSSIMKITAQVTQAAVGGAVVLDVADLSNIKWGSTLNGSEYSGNTTNYEINGNVFKVKTNAFVTKDDGVKTIYFSANYIEPYTKATQYVAGSCVLTVTQIGTNATFVSIGGQTTIAKSIDEDVLESGCVFASLYRGSALDNTDCLYQWRVGPGYGVDDILDAAHPLVTSGYVKFKTNEGIVLNDFSDSLYIAGAPSNATDEPGPFINARGLWLSEKAITDKLLLKCTVKDTAITPAVYFDGYTTVIDKNDPYNVTIAASNGAVFKNSTGTTYLYPKVFKQGSVPEIVNNILDWTFKWFLMDKDGARGAFVTGESRTLHSTASFDVATSSFILSTALTSAPAAGKVIRVTKGLLTRYYVTAAGCTTTSIKVNAVAPEKVVEWITLSDFPLPELATTFNAGKLSLCSDAVESKLLANGTTYTLSSTTSYNETSKSFTLTAPPSNLDAGDVVFVRNSAANAVRFYEVASVSGNNVTVKASGFTERWINTALYPLPTATLMNGGKLVKVTGEPGVLVDGEDVYQQANIYVEVSKP